MSRAFTLIELLVVTGIVAVVASVLFPVLARAGQTNPSMTVRFGKVARGVLLYAADDEGKAPQYYGTATSTNHNPYHNTDTWAGRVFPYVRERSAFFDPTLAEPRATLHDAGGDLYADSQYGSKSPTDRYTYRWQWITTIGLNSDGFAMGGQGTCLSPVRYRTQRTVTTIERPEQRLMLAPTQEGGNPFGWDYFRAYEASRPNPSKTTSKPFSWNELVWNARARWNGRLAAAYADGHVGHFGQEKFVLFPDIGTKGGYCSYLSSHPDVLSFWGPYWSMR